MPKFLLNFKYYDIKRIVLIKNKLIDKFKEMLLIVTKLTDRITNIIER